MRNSVRGIAVHSEHWAQLPGFRRSFERDTAQRFKGQKAGSFEVNNGCRKVMDIRWKTLAHH